MWHSMSGCAVAGIHLQLESYGLNCSSPSAHHVSNARPTCTIWLSVKSSTTLRPPSKVATLLHPAVLLPALLNTTSATLPAASSLQVTDVKAAGEAAAAVMLPALRPLRPGVGPKTGSGSLMVLTSGAGSEGTGLAMSAGAVVLGSSVAVVMVVVVATSGCRGARGTAAAAGTATSWGVSSMVSAEGWVAGVVGATAAPVTPGLGRPPPGHAAVHSAQA